MKSLNTLNELNAAKKLNTFYCITLNPAYDELKLQGDFCDSNTQIAKDLGVELVYDQSIKMLRGKSSDGSLSITLT